MKTRIRSFILAMLLVLSMAASSLAAGTGSAAGIILQAEQESDIVTLSVYLTAESATNGRVQITYDRDSVKLVEVLADDEGITNVNRESAGEVFFAWVGSDLPSTKKVLTLVFQVTADEGVDVTFEGVITELYADELDLIGDSTKPSDTETITIGEVSDEPVVPTPNPSPDPTPTPDPGTTPDPGPGTTPDPGPTPGGDDDEDEDTPGADTPGLTEEVYDSIVAKYPDIRGHWAEEDIVKAINAGLFNGTSENTFTPDGVVTRGMFVTLLYRLSGEPAVSGGMPFTDVPPSQYYADAVKWAYGNNIVNGVTATEFKSDLEVTREQMVTMLYRYAQFVGGNISASVSLSGFGDADEVNDWAAEAMSWAVAEGIINGSNGNLNPGDASTRAQIATVLVRYAGL